MIKRKIKKNNISHYPLFLFLTIYYEISLFILASLFASNRASSNELLIQIVRQGSTTEERIDEKLIDMPNTRRI